MPDVSYELLWQRVVAALRLRNPGMPADATPEIVFSLPKSAATADIGTFLTAYYYPSQYGATSQTMSRVDAERLVERIERACNPPDEPRRVRAVPDFVRFPAAFVVALGIMLSFGLVGKDWGWFFFLGTMAVLLIATDSSWRQIGLIAVSLVVLFGAQFFFESTDGEMPAWWGTRGEAGLAPRIISIWMVIVWFSGLFMPQSEAVSAEGTPVATSDGRRISGVVRASFLIVGLFCLLVGVLSLWHSTGAISTPRTIILPGFDGAFFSMEPRAQTTWVTARRGENGFNFADGLALALAGLLALNRASKRRSDEQGFCDRLLNNIWAADQSSNTRLLAPAVLAVLAVGWFGYLLVQRTEIHWNSWVAADAFAAAGLSNNLYVTGNVMYGVTNDGAITHIAHFTPSLVREIGRADLGVGGFLRDFEYPMPGILPIVMLMALSVARAVQLRRPALTREPREAAPWLLAAGLIELYVVAWLVSAQRGIFYGDGIHPGWAVDLFLVLLPVSVMTLGLIHRKAEAGVLPAGVCTGWISLYQLSVLAPVAWSYFSSDAAAGSPVLLWILLYLAAACLLWCLILAGGRTLRTT